ncbi:hypothetical protein TUM12370_20000 [Salmonella enterica subsp. enterica serovar Choleraesuis]|nr:hypothetical protein TUM12370_20000 [Salmonella enterica subsp. enterica serovar Choleraesuis]
MLDHYIQLALADSHLIDNKSHQQWRDERAEVLVNDTQWTFEDGVVLRCLQEDELEPVQSDEQCPESWITWSVVDSGGLNIEPREKHFFSACQQRFWLTKRRFE